VEVGGDRHDGSPLDRKDVLLAVGLGLLALLVFRSTSQVLLFHDASAFRDALVEGRRLYIHLLWLPTLHGVRDAVRAMGFEVGPEAILYGVSAISGGVLVAFTFLACRLFAPRGIALLSAILVGVTPAVWFQSASACLHAFSGALVAVAFFALLRLDSRAGLGRRLIAGLALALVPLGHVAGVFLLPALLACARLRGGTLLGKPVRSATALFLPPLVGLAALAWLGSPSRMGPSMPSLRLVEHLPGLVADFWPYLLAGVRQIATSMTALLGIAMLGWIVAWRVPRGPVFPGALALFPLLLGTVWWGPQDRKGAYYVGLVGFFAVSGLFAWRALATRFGRAVPAAILVALLVGQAAVSIPSRLREADREAYERRAESLFRTGALVLYEPDRPLATFWFESAQGRIVLNLFIVDFLLPPGEIGRGLELLRREGERLRGREVVLDRNVYKAVGREGSPIAEWFRDFRAWYVAEPLPDEPGFEILRPKP